MSTFSGIELGLRALRTQRVALEVTSHNIANANTPGYSRQRADMAATPPHAVPSLTKNLQPGQMGTGVAVTQITHMRDRFLDEQIRHELSLLGEWKQSKDILNKLELFMNEPSEEGLANALDLFFSNLEELSTNPESVAVRENLRQQGETLCSVFQRMHRQLTTFQEDLDQEVRVQINDLNDYARQLADLNVQITRVIADGDNPNDLKDHRQLLVEELSEMVAINVNEDTKGNWNITIEGHHLVQGDLARTVEAFADPEQNDFHNLRWTHNGEDVKMGGGSLASLINGRDQVIEGFKEDLDLLANTFMDEFNAVHAEGYGLDSSTGLDFFAGEGARNMSLSQEVMEDLSVIAASSVPDVPGNSDNVLELLELREKGIFEGEKVSLEDFHRSLITRLGVMGRKAEKMQYNQEILVEGIKEQQEQVSGVSLDEEMADMIRFQHAYNAGSRIIIKVDEMIQTLLGMVR